MWLYSTFDNVDGKQARRTKTSSPLGELFDHGCDALNTATGALMQAACLGLGHSPLSTLILWTTTVPFYFSTWEEYHTGVLYLGYINGPTEGLVLSSLSMFVAGIYGPQIFHQPLHTIVPWLQTSVRGIDVLVVALLVGVFVFHIPPCVMAVYRACQEKRTSFVTALWQLMPMVSYQVAIYAWLYSPYSIVMAQHYFILFTLTVGVVFGRVATKIILAHVTKMPFPMFTVLLLPLYGGALLVNLPLFGLPPVLTATGELYYLLAYLAFAVVAYFHWAFLVIDRFCTYLDIYCLTIKHKHQE
jgi:ethanolaminephosphotransferase